MDVPPQLQKLGDLVPEGFLLVDTAGVIRHANAQAAELLGVALDDLIGRDVDDFVPVAVRSAHAAHRASFATESGARPMAFGRVLSAVRADGNEIDVDVALRPIIEDGHRFVAATIRDISDRTTSHFNQALIDFLIESSTDAVAVVDTECRTVGINDQFRWLLGLSGGEIIGESLIDHLPVGSRRRLQEICQTVIGGQRVSLHRMEIETHFGTSVPIRFSAAPIRHPNGRVVGAGLTLADLSELTTAQETLMQVQRQVERTESVAALGSWSWDRDTNEVQWSAGMHQLYELSPLDFDGTLAQWMTFVPTTETFDLRESLAAAASAGTPFRVDAEIHTADGRRRWVTIDGVPTTDGHGVRGICQDLTERHAAMSSLLEADRLKDEFLSTVSHELRTPLTVICGFAEVLAAQADETMAPYMQAVVRNSTEMAEMVEQLLDYSRLQSGRTHLVWTMTDAGALVRDVLTVYEVSLSGHTVVTDIGELPIACDEHAFRRVVTNLMTNAAKYSEAGTTITVAAEPVDDDFVAVSITDQGMGIPDDELDAVFERFHRVQGNGRAEIRGSGVGLSIVSNYVHLWGGEITATSSVGVGSTFTFTVPRQIPKQDVEV